MTDQTRDLSDVIFQNPFAERFLGDQSGDLKSRLTPEAFYAIARPTPTSDPTLIAWSNELGSDLGLRRPQHNSINERILAGGTITDSMVPFAARYGGHQFGVWAGQLGDGRAITLGEIPAPNGKTFEIQLKGAGRTAYSRRADGRAVLRSSLREFIASEAMHHLGIPTTRALSLTLTGEKVERDMFYSGDPQWEPGAITCRVAPTFLRFGHFEILASENNKEGLDQLFRYTVKRFFPQIDPDADTAVEEWFTEVSERTALMIAQWMGYGFVHGVMNTDNMSVLGVTIDYGPFGWLEPYESNWTPNTTDFQHRRYSFGQQPVIGFWNLSMLATALVPIVTDTSALDRGLDRYRSYFPQMLEDLIFSRLGLTNHPDRSPRVRSASDLLGIFAAARIDMTIFFRVLTDSVTALTQDSAATTAQLLLDRAAYSPSSESLVTKLVTWCQQYSALLNECGPRQELQAHMLRVNPAIVPRNWILQEVIDACDQGNFGPLEALQRRITTPYESAAGEDLWEGKRPEWAATRAGCATLSCSS